MPRTTRNAPRSPAAVVIDLTDDGDDGPAVIDVDSDVAKPKLHPQHVTEAMAVAAAAEAAAIAAAQPDTVPGTADDILEAMMQVEEGIDQVLGRSNGHPVGEPVHESPSRHCGDVDRVVVRRAAGGGGRSVLLTRLLKRGMAPGAIEGRNIFLRRCRRSAAQMAVSSPSLNIAPRVKRQVVFLRRNVRDAPDRRPVPANLAIMDLPELVQVRTVVPRRKMTSKKAKRVVIWTPRAPSPPPRSNPKVLRVVTPRAAAPAWKAPLQLGAVLCEEAETRRKIAERDGRLYFPAKRRHLVQGAVGPHAPCHGGLRRGSGRARAVTPCRIIAIGRRPVAGATPVTPQPRRRGNKRFYRFIDDEAEEVPHELAVLEDEAIPAERRPGYDTDPDDDGDEEESEGDDEGSDPTWEAGDGNEDETANDDTCMPFVSLVGSVEDDGIMIS